MPVHSKRDQKRSLSTCVGPLFAALEPRVLMDGNVASSLASGNLTLRGDKHANSIEVTQLAPDQYQITGLNGTTIDGHPSITRKITGKLTINLGDGNDSANITESIFDRLTVDMGRGDDDLALGDVGARVMSLNGSRGMDTLIDLGSNDLAHSLRGFEFDEFPDDVNDSFAAVDLSQFFAFDLKHGKALDINETQSQRLITDYSITKDRRGRVRVTPVYTNIVTGLIGQLIANVTPDRQQIEIEARLTHTTLDGINKLGIMTPMGTRFIDQPIISTLNMDTNTLLPDGVTFQLGSSQRTEGPIALESSFILQPLIFDDDPNIPLNQVQVDVNFLAFNQSANSLSLKNEQVSQGSDNFDTQMQFLVGAGVQSLLSHTTQRLVLGGYETGVDKEGNRTLNTLSNAVDSGVSFGVTATPNKEGDAVRVDVDFVNRLMDAIKAKDIKTAIGKQLLQLPRIAALRVVSQVSLRDGESETLAELLTAGSERPNANVQVQINANIIPVSGKFLTEIGIDLNYLGAPSDDRKISVTVDSGATATVESKVQDYYLTDFAATFGLGGVGAMKTIVSPVITGFNYTTQPTGVKESKATALTTITEVSIKDNRTVVLGTGFGTERVSRLTTSTSSATTKVPLLSDLPVLGSLFRGSDAKKVKTSLIIVVTPRITVKTEVE